MLRSFLSTPRLLLSLLFLLPGVALATPGSGLPGTDAPRAYHLLEPETSAAEAGPFSSPSWRPHPVFRVGTELLVGAAAGVGGGLAGARLGGISCERSGRYQPDAEGSCLVEQLSGLWLGSSLGFALGTWGGGSLMGGRGHILHTLGGLALGLLVGTASFQLTRGYINAVTGAALLTPYVFSVVAYELSSATAAPPPPPASVRLQPVLSVSSRGAVLGLAGSF